MDKQLTKNQYSAIHIWLKRKYGSANKCENEDCEGKSKFYQYALIHGKEHERNRGNYMTLCISCHLKYDWDESKRVAWRKSLSTTEAIEKIRNSRLGKKASLEAKENMSKARKGTVFSWRKDYKKENHPCFGLKFSDERKRKMMLKRGMFSLEQISSIIEEYNSGVEQKEIAKKYNCSKATICRIVNKKVYKLA